MWQPPQPAEAKTASPAVASPAGVLGAASVVAGSSPDSVPWVSAGSAPCASSCSRAKKITPAIVPTKKSAATTM